jgi:hypothetical protein
MQILPPSQIRRINDYRGSGAFFGRITLGLVAVVWSLKKLFQTFGLKPGWSKPEEVSGLRKM